MRKIPTDLAYAFKRALMEQAVAVTEHGDSIKWLRYYLDFCAKYEYPPRDRDSLPHFLNKLASKAQSKPQQEQAATAIQVYYELMKDWADLSKEESPLTANEKAWEECYRLLKEEIRLRQYSPKTLKTYRVWVSKFQRFLRNKHPDKLDSDDARKYLSHLAVEKKVVASTQNQAFNALLFFYRHIIKSEYELKDKVVRARRTRYIPVVLNREEVDAIIDALRYPQQLAIQLMYGCGLRLFECLNLRVQCFNFDANILTIHDGKGKKDRTVPLPQSILPQVHDHMDRVEVLHRQDLAANYDGVFMPGALSRKWKSAAKEIHWQWFFPAKTLTLVPESGEYRRYHMHETNLQKALRTAVRKTGVRKRVTSHTFRHSFASHLLQANYDIRTIQELLGHSDVRTTMIYLHTVKSKTIKEVGSPLDFEPVSA